MHMARELAALHRRWESLPVDRWPWLRREGAAADLSRDCLRQGPLRPTPGHSRAPAKDVRHAGKEPGKSEEGESRQDDATACRDLVRA